MIVKNKGGKNPALVRYLQPQPPRKGLNLSLQQQSSTKISGRQPQEQILSIIPDKQPLPHEQRINKIISK